MQFQQFRPLGGIGHLQAHVKAEVLAFEKGHQPADVGGGPVAGRRHQQQLQLSPGAWGGIPLGLVPRAEGALTVLGPQGGAPIVAGPAVGPTGSETGVGVGFPCS